jgi:hypothetical protein
MGFVRNLAAAAWVLSGPKSSLVNRALIVPFGMRGWARPARQVRQVMAGRVPQARKITRRGVAMLDLLYIGLTLVVFAVLILIVKGIETFER